MLTHTLYLQHEPAMCPTRSLNNNLHRDCNPWLAYFPPAHLQNNTRLPNMQLTEADAAFLITRDKGSAFTHVLPAVHPSRFAYTSPPQWPVIGVPGEVPAIDHQSAVQSHFC